jgi:hypothetical protein
MINCRIPERKSLQAASLQGFLFLGNY